MKTWRIFYHTKAINSPECLTVEVKIKAASLDEALAKARTIDRRFNSGQITK